MSANCPKTFVKLLCYVRKVAANGIGLGEVAEPEVKLEHKTLKLKTND